MSTREEISKLIEGAKERRGDMWYRWFDNFGLATAGCPMRGQVPSILDDYPKSYLGISGLRQSRTHRQFYEDIDRAFREAGTFEEMLKRSVLLTEAHDSRKDDRIVEAEKQVAETYIEPFILLIEMGYSREDF